MKRVGQIGLVVIALMFALPFAAAFLDSRHQHCGWGGDHGNCHDARGTMAISGAVIMMAVSGLVWMARKGRG